MQIEFNPMAYVASSGLSTDRVRCEKQPVYNGVWGQADTEQRQARLLLRLNDHYLDVIYGNGQ